MTHNRVVFNVFGMPAPKGSTRSWAFKRKDGRLGTSTTNANPRTWEWEAMIAKEAAAVRDLFYMAGKVPIHIDVVFYFPKPPSTPKKVANKMTKPDLDKLIRCVGDALNGVLYDDDAQVVAINARKKFVAEGAAVGAHIEIYRGHPEVEPQ